jgi:hypothetical protein
MGESKNKRTIEWVGGKQRRLGRQPFGQQQYLGPT